MNPVFVTGTGTDVGKTIASAIIALAWEADYWKPVQAGNQGGTDSDWIKKMIKGTPAIVHPESYLLAMAASPHLSAKQEGTQISIDNMLKDFSNLKTTNTRLVIEGAGGLLVPLNDTDFVVDFIEALHADVVLVSRNYLGSINHSLMTASVCRSRKLNVLGWIFNDEYMNYQQEIATWSGYPVIGAISRLSNLSRETISEQSGLMKVPLLKCLERRRL